jgi:hypothetical protein
LRLRRHRYNKTPPIIRREARANGQIVSMEVDRRRLPGRFEAYQESPG